MWTRRRFVALACGGLAACGGLVTVAPMGSVARLTFAQFPSLATAGGSAVAQVAGQFPIIVIRTSATAASALSATCTHASCIVGFDGTHVHCNCHDADFDLDGNVLRGPPPVPLPAYAAAVEADAIAVTLI
jgi:nitrite reductase/ring-hydroxylating ferredoxin subunit